MRDPYQVLGVSPNATDEELKKAYRDLARKYHPDNYHDNPLADLAQERMKETNEAYEAVQSQRKRSSGDQSGYGGYGAQGYGQQGYGYQQSGDPRYHRVRAAVSQGDLNMADELLNAMPAPHDGQWHFLKGVIYNRRGWNDEARKHLETAVQMEPDNLEYRRAYQSVTGAGQHGYNPFGGTMHTTDCSGLPCLLPLCLCSGGYPLFCCV